MRVAVVDRRDELPEQVARLVLAEEGAIVLRVLPPGGHVAGQAAALRVLQDQGEVGRGDNDLQGVDDVDVAVAQLGLYLHARLPRVSRVQREGAHAPAAPCSRRALPSVRAHTRSGRAARSRRRRTLISLSTCSGSSALGKGLGMSLTATCARGPRVWARAPCMRARARHPGGAGGAPTPAS